MPTIKDVARQAGVSTATVSAVLNQSSYVSPALRERVETAVRNLGYHPSRAARNLRSGRSEIIALITADLADPFYMSVVRAAERAIAARGYALALFDSAENGRSEADILDRVRALTCDGLIWMPVGDGPRYSQEALKGGPPKVILGREFETLQFDTVTLDNFAAGRRATDYLLDLGHRRIGSIAGPRSQSTGRGRLDGLLAAMRTAV